MQTTPFVVVVGSYNQDLLHTVARFPSPGETLLGRVALGPGGKGCNQAVAAARAGAQTRFVAAVGADAFGQNAVRLLEAEGIQHRIVVKPDQPTGTATVIVDASGQNMIIVALGANAALEPQDVPDEVFAGAGMALFQLESPQRTVAAALAAARRCGLTTVLNPAPAPSEPVPHLLEHVDVLVPNETELRQLWRLAGVASVPEPAELSGAELHALCRQLGPPVVIATLGAAGAFVSTPDDFRRVPAHRQLPVVDTVGAGDAFLGGLAAGWVQSGRDLDQAVTFATAAAGLAITRAGAAQAMPSREEIVALLRTSRTDTGT